jgi:hypothetical protein
MIKLNYSRILVVLLMMAGSTLSAQVICTNDSISFTTTLSGCSNDNGTATVTIHGGIPPYTYVWNTLPPQTSQTAINLSSGMWTVAIIDSAGCTDTGTVYIDAVAAPSICMVTVNGTSTNNIIYWDRSLYDNVDSFFVYRETSPSYYRKIAVVSNDSLGQYVDTARSIGPANGDPNLASYRYKLQIRDTCGNMSQLSPYHNTIYIVDDGGGQFSWSIPYTIEGMANPVTNYILLCDTAGVDLWGPVAAVGGGSSSAIDPGFADHSTIANWRVKTSWGIVCDPTTRATVNTTRSNIKHPSTSTSIALVNSDASVFIYPNPAKNQVTLMLSPDIKNADIKIINVMGQTIHQEKLNSAGGSIDLKLDVSSYAKGIYTVHIEKENSMIVKKLIIQ